MSCTWVVRGLIVGLLACSVLGCQPEPPSAETLFHVMSPQETGIDFVNGNVESASENVIMYEYFYNGGGVALGDINNDGLVDIYFTANQKPNKLYLNKGNFRFEDITESAHVSCPNGWKTGVAMVDINGDGYLDIYVCRSADPHPLKRQNLLYINNKDNTFTEKSFSYGLHDDSYTSQASFLDFDRDGDLDMILLNHSLLSISNTFDISIRKTHERTRYVGNKLYRNDNGHFHDVSDSLGIYGPAWNYGLGIAYGDVNNDGWLDIYTSNDYTAADKLLINQQGRSFVNQADSMLSVISQFSMGVDMADINNDGWTDILSVDMLPEGNKRQKELFWPDRYDVYTAMVKNGLHHQLMRNMLHLNNGDGTFSEIGQLAGVSNTDWSWAPLFADFDNDGLQDLFITNGYKRDFTNNDFLRYKADLLLKLKQNKSIDKIEDVLAKMPSNKLHCYAFRNQDGISFSDVSDAWGFGALSISNGAAYGDLDNDGDLDLVLNRLDTVAGIYRNDSGKDTHYLKVKLVGADDNTFGLGAKVTAFAGGKLMSRTLCPYRGFQSSVEPKLFFGLGDYNHLDSIIVNWPNGRTQMLEHVQADQELVIREEGKLKANTRRLAIASLGSTTALPFAHRENEFIDFKTQTLLPRSYSSEGPAMAIADVNADGLPDVFWGGAKGSDDRIYLQRKEGGYRDTSLSGSSLSESTDAIFFDMDNDNDEDLYVVTGGYEFSVDDPLLHDRLYRNDGRGNFTECALPAINVSGSCVRPADVDGDGDVDLFVGGRVVPGRYPTVPGSNILINDGRGNFTISRQDAALEYCGMVTDAAWLDVNADKLPDLIVVGEWMPVKVFINEKGNFIDRSGSFVTGETSGWWNCIQVADVDGDGRPDLIAGNNGNNNQFKPGVNRPMMLYADDFDKNGSIDPILTYYIGEESYPSATRDELLEQLPALKKEFPDYASYARATIGDILSTTDLTHCTTLKATRFQTTYFHNEGTSFTIRELPIQAQFAPVYDISIRDVDGNRKPDLILGGNQSKMAARFGPATGNFGTVLSGDGRGNFAYVPSSLTGLCVKGDVRKMAWDGDNMIIATNNGSAFGFRLKLSQEDKGKQKNGGKATAAGK